MNGDGLHVSGLHFAYDDTPVLRGIDLHVPADTSTFLLGPSGCGKSTLLRCIAGLETPDAGTVSCDGRALADVPTHERRIGLLFQEPALFPHLDVRHNIGFGLRYQGIRGAEADRIVDDWLDRIHLTTRGRARVDELSGGQRQRVALARTLAARPDAVLLDEPLTALDRDLRERLGSEVRDLLRDSGVAALWVTHDEEEAERLGDAVWRMADGRIGTKEHSNPT